jgi:CheY-like chemotaxis protein
MSGKQMRLANCDLPAPAPPPAPIERPDPASGRTDAGSRLHRVLVVDDSVDVAQVLAMVLEHCGYDVHVAHDGETAIEVARAFQPQFVLLDISMPGMSGHVVAQQLRRQAGLERATLVALSGHGEEQDRRQSQEAGFDYHLTKPVSVDILEELFGRSPV